ncbi:MAG: hypothetical protein ACMXYK_04120 [Candidatus Woesearchaeota archaeon]
MDFADYIATHKVVWGTPDTQKSVSLQRMATAHIDIVCAMDIDEHNSSLLFAQGYECLRQILEAMALLEGYKVYSHEAYVAYLQQKGEVLLSHRFDRLRKLRNGINYYGKPISLASAQEGLKEIKESMDRLIATYLS